MAYLKNLVVAGASRFLNKIYCEDIDVGGTASFDEITTGTLSVTGTSTLTGAVTASSTITATGNISTSGTLAGNGGYLTLNSKRAMDGGKTTANQLLINGTNAFSAGTYIKNKLITDNIEADSLYTPSIRADNIYVYDTIRSKTWDVQIVQTTGEQMISPMIYFQSTATVQTVNVTATTVQLTITDTSIGNGNEVNYSYAGASWFKGSRVKMSGKIGNAVLGTCNGTLLANMGSTSNKLQVEIEYDNSGGDFVANTSYTHENLSAMLFAINHGTGTTVDLHPVGIYLSAYDENRVSSISIYGGTNTSSYATPDVRLGLLRSLDPLPSTGITPSGFGLYSTNVFLKGTIVAQSGTIGGWSIGGTFLSSGTLGQDGSMWLTTADVGTAVKFAGISTATKAWRIGTGSKFGVTSDGTLYATNAYVTGNIKATSGSIAGWEITSDMFKKVTTATDGVSYRVSLNAAETVTDPANAAFVVEKIVNDSHDSYPVLIRYNGSVTMTNADVTGTITATGGYIGDWVITSNAIYNGMTSLTDTTHDGAWLGINGIALGKGKFKVTNAGVLTATSGTVGGWSIEAKRLYSQSATSGGYIAEMRQYGYNTSNYAFIITDRTGSSSTVPFGVKYDGTAVMTNATVTGTINANDGSIGNWTIGTTAIYNGMTSLADTTHNGAWLGTDGIALGKGAFKVTNGGVLTSTSGTIGGWSINANTLEKETTQDSDKVSYRVVLNTGSVSPTQGAFFISKKINGTHDSYPLIIRYNGTVVMNNAVVSGTVNASDGTIGGFTIEEKRLYSQSNATKGYIAELREYSYNTNNYAFIVTDRTGTSNTVPFYVKYDGTFKSSKGTIGPWTISDSAISTGGYNTASKMYFGTSGLSLSNTFRVTSAGKMYSTSAEIGGWDVAANSIEKETTKDSDNISYRVCLNTGSITPTQGAFFIQKKVNGAHDSYPVLIRYNGSAVFTNLVASGGTVGGWTIGSSALYNGMTSLSDTTNNGVWVGTDGIALGKGNFKVTNSGVLTAKSGTVGGFTLGEKRLYCETATTGGYIAELRRHDYNSNNYAFIITDRTGSSNTIPFCVTYDGSATLKKGYLGQWRIDSTGLFYNSGTDEAYANSYVYTDWAQFPMIITKVLDVRTMTYSSGEYCLKIQDPLINDEYSGDTYANPYELRFGNIGATAGMYYKTDDASAHTIIACDKNATSTIYIGANVDIVNIRGTLDVGTALPTQAEIDALFN